VIRVLQRWAAVPRAPVYLLLFCLAIPFALRAQLSTPDHLADPGFWPTKPDLPRNEYVGPSACASCHPTIFAAQPKTSMARTAQFAERDDLLHAHAKLNFAVGPYRYEISSQGAEPTYSITFPDKTLAATLQWAFGTGRVGQSYLFRAPDKSYREARVTFFSSLDNLHFTPARAFTTVPNIDEAMYRTVSQSEIARCFGCHTTAAVRNNQVDEKNLFLGVTCEACHGPGAKHVAIMQAAELAGTSYTGPPYVLNPASLDPMDSVDFCGACHATWWDVKLSGMKGVSNARSQPFRLELSKCWGKGDSRLTCMGCHDPHYQLDSVPENYDHVCLSCHAAAAAGTAGNTGSQKSVTHPSLRSCPVGTKDCVTCHMPKVMVPEMHYRFTDHKIQITHAGEAYSE